MGALGRVVRSGVGRRRVQTVVVALATLMAVASAVVAGSLIVASSAPFDHAFAQQRGPHLTAQIDAAKASPAQLAATANVPGVTASAGPYPVTVISLDSGSGFQIPDLTVAGRPSAGGALDHLTMTAGRWPAKAGEIVIPADFPPDFTLGSTLRVSGGAVLTVVGQARSVSRTADAWVLPEQISALRPSGTPEATQMLYRFSSAGTKDQMAADRKAIAAALPQEALLGAQSYLEVKFSADRETAVFVPFLLAFGGLGLFMSIIIISSVVSGAVGAGVRRIGILKALGFSPGQVVRAYLAQALIPAAVGTVLGVVLGNLLAVPLLSDAEDVYESSGLSVAWWVSGGVAAAALVVVVVAALLPALRAGRLRTVEAIAVGRAPSTGRGQWAHRAVGRLPLPRAITLGLASPFARPVRTAAMLGAVIFGTAAVTFSIGLASSLHIINSAGGPDEAAVMVVPGRSEQGPPQPLSAADGTRVRAALQAQPGTQSFYGTAMTQVAVAGVSGPLEAELFEGDSRSGAYEMISGHWFTGPGQAVVPTHFLDATGTRIGDTITVIHKGVTVPLRIVGEAFDVGDDGMILKADITSFKSEVLVHSYHVSLKPGVSASAYLPGLRTALQPLGVQAITNSQSVSPTIIVLDSMAALLTLMLVAVAGLGVLNSVVLDTRERVHDLGVCKAIGMSPRQTVTMVLASVIGIGAAGGLIGVPTGIALHGYILPLMGEAAGTRLTSHMKEVYEALELLMLGLGGVVIAVLGAMIPAGWAARAKTGTALRTE